MPKPHPVPSIGDTVVLNDYGLEVIFGTSLGLQHMKSLRMKITWVDQMSMTEPEETFIVEVDNADIDAFLIYHTCFDIVETAKTGNVRYESWGSRDGRGGVQRTLDVNDQDDMNFLTDGIQIVDANGKARNLTLKEAEEMGIRRVVAARDIHTGVMKWRE